MRKARVLCAGVALAASCASQPADMAGDSVSGAFVPSGPPRSPVRADVAGACVVDLVQAYDVSGSLTGSLEIDFRILVHGPCGSPPGTFDEEWIAVGSFSGAFEGAPAESRFTYVAQVRAGGLFEGRIAMGDGLEGELAINGDFGRGVAYQGRLSRSRGPSGGGRA